MITLGPIPALGARLFTPWSGAWTIDVDIALEDVPLMPSGPTVVTINTNLFVGTIDPRASGRFGSVGRARVVAGGGGWDKVVPERPYASDAGVPSTLVRATTGVEVGELVVELGPPKILGASYVRTKGPAARVLPAQGWYVTPQGVTTIGPRLPIPASPDTAVSSFDPLLQVAELLTDSVIAPGTILLDPQFDTGTATVRDVEQTWNDSGARARAWVSSSKATRLASALAQFAREASGVAYAKAYEYRVVIQNPLDGRLALQCVDRDAGVPDLLPISIWAGLPGVKVTPVPGTRCAVIFLNGDPGKPIAVAFEPAPGIQPFALAPAVAEALGAINVFIGILQTTVPAMVTGYSALTDPQKTAFTGGVSTAQAALTAALPLIPSKVVLEP